MYRHHSPIRICLVDDDEDAYVIIRDMLGDINIYSYEIRWIASFEEALGTIPKEEFDVFLIDYRLGVNCGLDLIEPIREAGSAPVVILTGQNEREIDMLAMQKGAADYLQKHRLDSDMLEHTIRYVIERNRVESALRDSEKRYRTLFENVPIGLFRITPDGTILNANMTFKALTRFARHRRMFEGALQGVAIMPPASEGISIRDIFTNPQLCGQFFVAIMREGSCRNMEIEIPTLSEDRLFCQLSATASHDENNVLQWIDGVIEDITERRRLQSAEQERQAALAATQAKNEFLANVSHEIRTPLNAIIGLGNLMWKTELTSRQKNYLRKIWTASYSLLAIINDILDFSKVEAGRIELEKINFVIDDTLDTLTEIFSNSAQEKGLELIFAIDPAVPHTLNGDPHRIIQVLNNLINNALKFTRQGEVVVRIAPEQRSNEQVRLRFSVSDTGIGMDASVQARLFQSFMQGDASTTREYGGTGLGLAICKRLVELMGGSIWVESVPGVGSTFSFSIPLDMPPHEEHQRSIPAILQGRQVLVVDDNATSREMTIQLLAGFSLNAHGAESGPEALRLLAARDPAQPAPDLVLLDWRMPGMDGIETLEKIRSQPHGKDLPVIMMSAYRGDEVHQDALNLGSAAFLTKPFNTSLLYNTCLSVLSTRMAHNPVAAPERTDQYARFSHLKGSYVLVVDDNAINQEVAVEMLNVLQIRTDTATDGGIAVELNKRSRFDAILMDIQMPAMDGWEATRMIRSGTVNTTVPIIAMTAHGSDVERERCLECGMNDFIAKPIEAEPLFTILNRWIKPCDPALATSSTLTSAKPEPASTPAGDLPNLAGIAIHSALKRLNHNTALYRRILGQFAVQNHSLARDLDAALNKDDLKTIGDAAHAIMGTAGNIGAMDLAAAASRLRNAVSDGNRTQVITTLEFFQQHLAMVLTSLAQLDEPGTGAERPEAGEAQCDIGCLRALLDELERSLNHDLSVACRLMEDLLAATRGSKFARTISALEKQLNSFDIEGLGRDIAQIRSTLPPPPSQETTP